MDICLLDVNDSACRMHELFFITHLCADDKVFLVSSAKRVLEMVTFMHTSIDKKKECKGMWVSKGMQNYDRWQEQKLGEKIMYLDYLTESDSRKSGNGARHAYMYV